jgi:hypothetical protein|tara:strand:- start:5 stop:400 length:396 start_codon:yes stop_codon:yes gene_type:complete
MNKEFTFLGNSMENIAMIYGIFLIVWGIGVTILSDSQSITSLIPAIFGLPIIILSFFAKKFPDRKKLLMHIVVLIGLIIFLGGLDLIRGLIQGNIFVNLWASSSKFMMIISGLVFTILCIKSFIFNRKNKL